MASDWQLLAGVCYSEVIVRTGSTVFKKYKYEKFTRRRF
jgi:hypothetical protein